MFNIVRQHTKFASETSIRGCLRASNDEILRYQEIKSHETNFVGAQLLVKSIESNETLHGARYDKYLELFLILSKSTRGIKRY